ncbi:MAG TPA: VOC family protein [Rhizomicrobium sp.]|nr:VOC family protein [Rhizomicrobium sp.]
MAGFLGIDHPLIAVRDIDRVRKRYAELGFTMTAVGKHPWGTSTALAMFDQCLLELMGIYDESLLDEIPAGDFRFGRTVYDHLNEREGISLLALHSEDAAADVETVAKRGIVSQGTISFGRDVVLPDGRPDRTATTLKILNDPKLPRLSNFLCQQHRPELIYVPQWLSHANGANGISQVTILVAHKDQAAVRSRFSGLYGTDALFESPGGFGARTGNGNFVVADRSAIEKMYGDLTESLRADEGPYCVAIHVTVASMDRFVPFLDGAGANYRRDGMEVRLTDAEPYGNVFLAFVESPTRRRAIS